MSIRANATLFRSLHALYAALALVALLFALGFELPRPWHSGGAHAVTVRTGWAALAAMLVVLGYVLRKYMHKLRYSPEFRHKVSLAELEAFDQRLNDLRLELLKHGLRDERAIRARLREALKGVERVLTVEIEPGQDEGEGEPPRLVPRPREPFGRTARWLHAHLYYGLLFAVLVFVHGRAGLHSPLGVALSSLALVLTLTGGAGILLWAFGPTWLSRAEHRHRLSIEQAFVFRRHYRAKIKLALAALGEAARPALALAWKARSAPDFTAHARLALQAPEFATAEPRATAELRAAAQEVLVLIGQYRRVRAALRELGRIRMLFMAWRYVHVPCAILLLGFAVLHVLCVWRY